MKYTDKSEYKIFLDNLRKHNIESYNIELIFEDEFKFRLKINRKYNEKEFYRPAKYITVDIPRTDKNDIRFGVKHKEHSFKEEINVSEALRKYPFENNKRNNFISTLYTFILGYYFYRTWNGNSKNLALSIIVLSTIVAQPFLDLLLPYLDSQSVNYYLNIPELFEYFIYDEELNELFDKGYNELSDIAKNDIWNTYLQYTKSMNLNSLDVKIYDIKNVDNEEFKNYTLNQLKLLRDRVSKRFDLYPSKVLKEDTKKLTRKK